MTLGCIYLAGPDVFLPNALDQAAAKIALCRDYGFDAVFPIDPSLDISGKTPFEAAMAISAFNEDAMRRCDLIIANATPFRGPSIDPGTAYEIGFMRALGGRAIYAYANVGGTYRDRVAADLGVPLHQDDAGRWVDPDGLAVEDFGLEDNLMIVGAVEATGGTFVTRTVATDRLLTDLTAFEDCLKAARNQAEDRSSAGGAGYRVAAAAG